VGFEIHATTSIRAATFFTCSTPFPREAGRGGRGGTTRGTSVPTQFTISRQEGEGEGLETVKFTTETANMTDEENMAEILQFDDDELEEFAVSDHKNEDAEMEDVSEIAATQSDHSSGKVSQFFWRFCATAQC
jgi:hypothetical protein